MIGRMMVVGMATLLVAVESLCAQPRVEERKVEAWHSNVKTWTEFKVTNGHRDGDVVQASDESVTVRWGFKNGRTVFSQVYPIDLLAGGKTVDGVAGSHAYRWSDIQKGDTVSLEVVHDDGDGREYCIGVCIRRRPGAKLPESQKPKKDVRYVRDSLFNDIDNGEDVSNETIAKVFPAEPYNPRTRMGGESGGLPKEYQEKLDAIREKAKKDKDLKATPPDKK